jgi:hypothetical protein
VTTPHAIRVRLLFFVATAVLSITVPLLVFSVTSDVYVRVFVSIFATLILILGFTLSVIRDISDNRIRLAILTITGALFAVILNVRSFGAPVLNSVFTAINNRFSTTFPTNLEDNTWAADIITALVLACTLLIAHLVLRSMNKSRAMGRPDISISDVLPSITNLDRIDILKLSLRGRLDRLDHESRWNDANYVSLQAEVQVLEGRSSKRRIVELLHALRSDKRTSMFVVLGDPGTGKSVAMRKLARDLLIESGPSDRIPLYINLKEWRSTRLWTPDHPPTPADFHNFVLNNLLQSLDLNSQSFLLENGNYRLLLEAGFFFFVFDSFDEIPAVLDHDENSWLISELSACIVTYALGGHNARAILASRLFRKPNVLHHRRSVLEIRPFSDDRIVQAIDRAATDPSTLKRIILVERRDLGSIARNPFLLNLIISHYNTKRHAPSSQADMFDTFFETSLSLARSAYGLKDMPDSDVYSLCENIAGIMFDSPNVGLEISDYEILRQLRIDGLHEVLRFLAQARIARIGSVSGAFSFSHRRFNEYFLVRRILSGRMPIPFDAIQTDSRWRDALVLFAEIASNSDADRLAKHAWHFASCLDRLSLAVDRVKFLQARHALRFLVDGFRNRPELLRPYHQELARIIFRKLIDDVDYIEKKTAVEAIGLLPIERSQRIILSTLRRYPGWISEQAAAAARYLPRIRKSLAVALVDYCTYRPGLQGVKEARRQEPIFAISDAFSLVAQWLKLFRWNFYKNCITLSLVLAVGVLADNMRILLVFLVAAGALFVVGVFEFVVTHALRRTIRPIETLKQEKVATPKRRRLGLRVATITQNPVRYPAFILIIMAFYLLLYALPFPRQETALLVRAGGPIRASDALVIMLCVLGALPISSKTWFVARQAIRGFRSKDFFVAGFIFVSTITLVGLVFLAASIGYTYVKQHWPEYGLYIEYAGYLGLTCLALLLAVPFGRLLFYLIKDARRLRGVKAHFSAERSSISADFLAFETSIFRSLYVDHLETVTFDHLEQLKNALNVWPNGKRPQIPGDLASVKLARLDAKWLELD